MKQIGAYPEFDGPQRRCPVCERLFVPTYSTIGDATCPWCGTLMWADREDALRTARAIAQLTALGGTVETIADGSRRIDMSDTAFGDDEWPLVLRVDFVTELFLNHTRVTDRIAGRLAGMRSLEVLELSGTHIGAETLAVIRRLQRLEMLTLSEVPLVPQWLRRLRGCRPLWCLDLDDTGLRDLDGLRPLQSLEWLYLAGTEITDRSLKSLWELPKLCLLDVRRTRVTQRGVADFERRVPGCEIQWGE